ncbi:MAG: hypothetical protein NT004_00465 [Bacteroidetes bacterium]|nr:hypothetical protein [Bacteroidota bacterium]
MKLKSFILFFILISSLTIKAQQDFRFLSGNQEIVQNCLDSVVYIIRQDYVLQSGNNPALVFGRGENKYFGRIYAVAVLADGKLWCDNKLLTPWAGDPNYQEYLTIDTLKPTLSDASARAVYSNKFIQVKPDTLMKMPANDSLMKISGIYAYSLNTTAKGLKIQYLAKSDAGWLALGNNDSDLNLNDSSRIKLSIYKDKPEYADKELPGKIKSPSNPTRVAGGFYILPLYSAGKVEWQLSGVVVKKLLNYRVASIPEKPAINTPEPKMPLTPINQKPPEDQNSKNTKKKKSGKK